MIAPFPAVDPFRRFALPALIFLGALWGLNTSMLKLAGMLGAPPIGVTTLQMTGAAIALFLFCKAKGIAIGTDRTHLMYYLNVGVFGTALASVNLVNTLRELPAGVMVLSLATIPLLTYAVSLVLRMERFDFLRLIGVLLGLAGVMAIVLPKASLPQAEDTTWFLIGMITPCCYTYANVYAARFRPPGSVSVSLSAGMFLLIALFMWPTALLFDQAYMPPIASPDLATLTIGIIIAVTCIAYFIFFELIRAIGVVGVSVVGYLVTLFGMIFGMLFFDESHSIWVWIAAGLIFSGMALVNGRQAAGALIRNLQE